ncbi:hypothetical protein BpV1_026 [Bathycoccus sp. RCC1105 virus BpV1]|jgi:hypothetical protein|uniref:hypothetical protein n=1 Tax=Bathycoccus sp. RCC1105 virus BpV1 TaxID=880159 RepID=UPI0001EF439F|nr:hypothetical protein BpV1_026 [Bathycoccus sp. RCC1105 virus BpV1]ADQ91653.1 hypothetical protein BpV1_026 [Bathycoccus sp. RCC1105 virus BpV1]|tara:strand:+ start:873 stop:1538 length:666 start_codon:yes stop_codon:yes gene_type:complete
MKYMNLSYAITVCNEARDLFSLVSFLLKVKDGEDEINILVDTAHVSDNVKNVLKYFGDKIVIYERDFDGNFAEHRNFHLTKCSGDYIFIIDPDEMPKENLITNIKKIINDSGAELVIVPRINLHPGFTKEWLKKCNFRTNELDWINWPDYISRVFKNDPYKIKYSNELHENIIGTDKKVILNADPSIAVWHIKSVEKQDNRWDVSGNFKVPEGDNLYDTLM